MRLRGFEPGDVPALVALQHRERGAAAPFAADGLLHQLTDAVRGRGAQVRVAIDATGAVAGAIAWLIGDEAMFAAPFIAPDAPAASALLDELFVHAATAAPSSIRVSTGALDSPRATALAARGFRPLFDMFDLSRSTATDVRDRRAPASEPIAPPAGTALVPIDQVDRARFRALYNRTFDGVPNSLPMSPAEIDEIVDGAMTFAAGTGAARDDAGAYVGFLHAERVGDGELAYVSIEAIGVDRGWRGRGVGAWLVNRLIGAARDGGVPEARATIASVNGPSLALHQRLGFTERFRRHVWEWRPG